MSNIDNSELGFEEYYMNQMQLRANLIDANVEIVEGARAVGKTEGVFGPRLLKVGNDMPGELSFLVHKTYAALLTNIWPNIQAYFSKPIKNGQRSMLEYGIDYVAGETKIPSHFKRPRYPIAYPKHSVLLRNGHHLQLVSSDQPESVAGRSGVHAFIEEMKHQKGEKLKSRLFPSLRGAPAHIRRSQYYQGITGVSDTARVDLGEDNWFEEYEKLVNPELIDEIANVSYHVNQVLYNIYTCENLAKKERNPIASEALRLEIEKQKRSLALWQPRLADMRRNAIYYIRASTFCNKDILGPKFFKTQLDSMDVDEFLTAICAVRRKAVVNRFFVNYNPKKHQFSDSYKYTSILSLDLKDQFKLTAFYLKHYAPKDEIYLGYDPGHFSSIVAGQFKGDNDFKIIKEFTAYYPSQQPELAQAIYEFFGADAKNKEIKLYFDRAANKRKEDIEQITTDARILKKELESYGFTVELMNEGQATVYHWMQFKLLYILFGNATNGFPFVSICENECPNLCSAIMLAPRKTTDGRIELDKTSEKKVPLKYQAALTTQLPSALIYLLHGLFWNRMPNEYSAIPDNILDNFSV